MIHRVRLIAVLSLLVPGPGMAGDSAAVRQEAVRDAVAKVVPAVVQIETVGGADEVEGFAVGGGPTTGLVVDGEGHVVSSSINFAHSPSGIVVRLPGGGRQAAQLVATDHNLKLSLLKVEVDSSLPVPAFAERERVRVGQWAIAVGKAFDAERPNVAVGIISALERVWGKVLQTDAAVSPNNYGGPLVDLRGHVVGLLVPMSPTSDEEVAGVEWYDSGIGFAVASDRLLQAVNRLKAGADLHAGRIGMVIEKSVAMSGPPIVDSVHPNGPAEMAGLKKGDRVVRIGGKNISRSAEIKYELATRYAGDTVDMLLRRGEETIECRATLVAELEPYRRPVLGILPQRGGERDPGATVRVTVPESPAARGGIVAGDRVVGLDGEGVVDSEEMRSRISRRKPGEKIAIDVMRGEDRRKVELTLAPAATTLPGDLPVRSLDPEAEPGRKIPLTLPQWTNEIHVYLPKAYSKEAQHGLLVWLRSVTDSESGVEAWEKHADGRGVIVVLVEPSSTQRWLPGEVELVRDVLRLCRSRFSVDSKRVVVGGRSGGGSLAYRTASLERDDLSGCIVFDARLAGSPIVDEPDNRFGLLIGRSEEGTLAEGLDRAAGMLRKGGLPVVVVSHEAATGRLADRDFAAIMRWIDLLDQI
jgi:serine protease Do